MSQYITIKLYSIIRSKTLLQTLFFHGITLSYSRVLSLIDELSATVLDLYQRSGNRALPSNVRSGIFSVFVDDNLDKNSSSSTAKSYFHGAGVSLLQFPIHDNLGEKIIKLLYKDLPVSSKSINISILDNYTNVGTCIINISKGLSLKQAINIPSDFCPRISDCYKENQMMELDWLQSIFTEFERASDAERKPLSWTAWHINSNRYNYSNQILT